MKKTLVALAVAAFASSASALTVYEADGSKVDFDGSIRLRLDKESTKTNDQTTKRGHSNLHDDGTRIGVKVNHTISDDLSAFGRLEFRFNKKEGSQYSSTDKFGDLYTKYAYVGLKSKQFGQVSFGKGKTVGDEIAQSGFDNAYGTWDTTLTTEGTSILRYDYEAIKGLHLGASYRFAENRDSGDSGEVVTGKVKSGYDVGAIYNLDVAQGQALTFSTGYSRNNYVTDASYKHHKDAYAFGAKYAVDALTLAADYAGAFEKKDQAKTKTNGLRVGAKYQVTDTVDVYGNYGYGVIKTDTASVTTAKSKLHKFMLGAGYKLHKNVFTYVEGGLFKAKNQLTNTKTTDKNIGAGLRVSW